MREPRRLQAQPRRHPSRQLLHDLPVGPALPHRRNHLPHPLHPPLAVGESALFLANDAAGSTTSAISAVSCIKMSCTTRKSSLASASVACARFGSVSAGFSPTMYMQRTTPLSIDSTISVARSPASAGSGPPQAALNLPSVSSV